MEADWSVEVGPGLPCIDASWKGFADLRNSQRAVGRVQEARQHPPLRNALLALNGDNSPVFTTKSDAWPLTAAEIDPDEFGAGNEEAHAGFASYIDIMERDAARFGSFAFHEQRVRDLTFRLRRVPLLQVRVDFVVRAAVVNKQHGYGFTLYAAGCGAGATGAYAAWQAVLDAAVAATMAAAHPPHEGE